jgi:hypothetical protein
VQHATTNTIRTNIKQTYKRNSPKKVQTMKQKHNQQGVNPHITNRTANKAMTKQGEHANNRMHSIDQMPYIVITVK